MDTNSFNDPHYSAQRMQERIKLLWFQLKTAQFSKDTRFIRPFFEKSLLEKCLAEMTMPDGRVIVPSRSAVLDMRLSDVAVGDDEETLTCLMTTKYRRVLVRKDSGKADALDRKDVIHLEEWTLTRPVGTQTPAARQTYSMHCEGCGAPVVLYRDTACPFCGGFIKVPDFTWKVTRIILHDS